MLAGQAVGLLWIARQDGGYQGGYETSSDYYVVQDYKNNVALVFVVKKNNLQSTTYVGSFNNNVFNGNPVTGGAALQLVFNKEDGDKGNVGGVPDNDDDCTGCFNGLNVIDGKLDLDGNGTADLVWRNTNTGAVSGWLMNGLTIASSQVIATVGDPGWTIRP